MPSPQILLLTRPRAQSEAFAANLAERLPGRFAPVISPLIEIAANPAPLDLGGARGLLFTSANGVTEFSRRTSARDLPAYCVGEMTAAAARAAGFVTFSAGGDLADLAALVARAASAPGAGAFVHVRGRHAAGDLAGRLAADGVEVRAAEIYDQTPRPLTPEARSLLARGEVATVAVFSPRSARLFAAEAAAAGADLSRAAAVSISAAADAALGTAGFGARIVASRPDREGMLEALARL